MEKSSMGIEKTYPGPEDNDFNHKNTVPYKQSKNRKIFLIAKKDKFNATLNFHFNPMGYEVIHYSDPISVIKKLDTSIPDMIIFHSVDFPRQWKALLRLLREKKSYDETIFILITSSKFYFEEAAKAAYLKVNGIIPENLLDKTVILQLYGLLKRYKSIDEKRKFIRLIPKNFDLFYLLFTHPIKYILISGIITDISLEGASFCPTNPELTKDLKTNQIIQNCSLRIGKDIITVHCRIARNRNELGFGFISFENEGHQTLFQYLMGSSERDIKHRIDNETCLTATFIKSHCTVCTVYIFLNILNSTFTKKSHFKNII